MKIYNITMADTLQHGFNLHADFYVIDENGFLHLWNKNKRIASYNNWLAIREENA